jgi:Mitochondrial genome maintenance MGM101
MIRNYTKLARLCTKAHFTTQSNTGFSPQYSAPASPTQSDTPFTDESFMSSSFEGASKEPFDSSILDKLDTPLDPNDVEVKPDGLLYYPGNWHF